MRSHTTVSFSLLFVPLTEGGGMEISMIREMTLDDYDDVFCLWTETEGLGLRSLDDSKEGIALFLKRNPRTSFVCVEDGVVTGVILCGHDGRRGYIYHTSVHPDYRRRKIAEKLLEHVMQALHEAGIHKAALVVFGRNETGNAFWEKQGFTVRRDLIYRNRAIDEIVRIDT